MKVLVDTSVWSAALRKRPETDEEIETVSMLSDLIKDFRVTIIGAIRQELLSGISDVKKFEQLKEKMRAFEDLEITTEIYELAADFSNTCRRNGIQGSHTDFLICAVASRYELQIFTLDNDFNHYCAYLPVNLRKKGGAEAPQI